jgi:hypothetical protein
MFAVNLDRLLGDLATFAAIGADDQGGVTRLAFSQAEWSPKTSPPEPQCWPKPQSASPMSEFSLGLNRSQGQRKASSWD